MLSQQVLEAWIQRIEETTSARITGNAEDITELVRRIETLVVERAGNDRTFRELISDKAELARRMDELGIRLGAHEGVVFTELARRIEELEERVVRHRQDREGDWARVAVRVMILAERIEKLENYAFERIGELATRVEPLERLLEREEPRLRKGETDEN